MLLCHLPPIPTPIPTPFWHPFGRAVVPRPLATALRWHGILSRRCPVRKHRSAISHALSTVVPCVKRSLQLLPKGEILLAFIKVPLYFGILLF